MTRIVTVTSGKGGVGKTNISANLALHLVELGYKVCLFDADFGLANINIVLKIHPEFNLKDVILGKKDLKDIIMKNFNGMDIIPGSSGVEEMANLSSGQIVKLINSFSSLDNYDFLIIDTAAGVSKDVIAFCLASYEIILVIVPDPSSLTDAYALLKILSLNGFKIPVMVVINMSPSLEHARKALAKLASTTERFLSLKLVPLGVIQRDTKVLTAVERQQAFISIFPDSQAAKSVRIIAQNLILKKSNLLENFTMETFWEKCLYFFTKSLKTGKKKINAETKKKPSKRPAPAPMTDSGSENGSTTETKPKPVKESVKKNIDQISSNLVPSNSTNIPSRFEGDALAMETNRLLFSVVESVSQMAEEIKEIRGILQAQITGKTKNSEEKKSKEEKAYITENKKNNHHNAIMDQLSKLLGSYAMFKTMTQDEIRGVVSRLKIKEYNPGEIIIQKGEAGKNLFIITSGKVEVIDEQGTVLDVMEKEDVFGEMSLISGDSVNATIRVLEKTKLLYLNAKAFINILSKHPPLQMFFAKLLSKRLGNRLKQADRSKTKLLESGLVGNLNETSLVELLQMLNMGQKTGVLSFYFTRGRASISFNKGSLVYAKYGTKTGKDAFFQILMEKEGRFVYNSDIPEEHALMPEIGHFMRLLMEGMSLIDEKN